MTDNLDPLDYIKLGMCPDCGHREGGAGELSAYRLEAGKMEREETFHFGCGHRYKLVATITRITRERST